MIRFGVGLVVIAGTVLLVSASLSSNQLANPPSEYQHHGFEVEALERVARHEWRAIRLPRDLAMSGNKILFAGSVTGPPKQTLYRILALPDLRVEHEAALDPVFSVTVDRIGTFWAYNLARRRLFTLGADSREDTIALQFAAGVFEPHWTDSTIVALGRFADGRLGFFDRDGELLNQAGPVPPGRPDVPMAVRQMLHRGDMALDRSGHLAIALYYYPVIELYDQAGNFVRALRGPYSFSPRFWVRDGALATDVTLRYAYGDVALGRQRVWALFSGRTREEDPYTASFGRFIHSYARSGGDLKIYEIEGYSNSILVDEELGCLYSAEATPAPALVVYQLPQEFGAPVCSVGQ